MHFRPHFRLSIAQASFCEGEMRVDDIALEKLATSFFAKAGKHMYDRLSLADFTTVFQSRMEIQESLQFGNFNARAKRDDRKDVDSLSFWERVQSRFLMTVQVCFQQLFSHPCFSCLVQSAGCS